LSPWAELEVLAEVLLVEDPAHQRTPLGAPVLVLRGVPMLHGHSLGCHVAIEAKPYVDEYLAHDSPLATPGVGLGLEFARSRKRAEPAVASRYGNAGFSSTWI